MAMLNNQMVFSMFWNCKNGRTISGGHLSRDPDWWFWNASWTWLESEKCDSKSWNRTKLYIYITQYIYIIILGLYYISLHYIIFYHILHYYITLHRSILYNSILLGGHTQIIALTPASWYLDDMAPKGGQFPGSEASETQRKVHRILCGCLATNGSQNGPLA